MEKEIRGTINDFTPPNYFRFSVLNNNSQHNTKMTVKYRKWNRNKVLHLKDSTPKLLELLALVMSGLMYSGFFQLGSIQGKEFYSIFIQQFRAASALPFQFLQYTPNPQVIVDNFKVTVFFPLLLFFPKEM